MMEEVQVKSEGNDGEVIRDTGERRCGCGAVENLDLSLPGKCSRRPRNVGLGAIAPEYHYLN